jgi:hypothetical protein
MISKARITAMKMAYLSARPALAVAVALVQPVAALGHGSLCIGNEEVVWSCKAHRGIHSLCASADLSETVGYLQYRVGTKKANEFSFPAEQVHPKGHFSFAVLPRAVSLTFTQEGREHSIGETITGQTTIQITRAGHAVASIACRSATETLSLTTTIARFRSIGIMD